MTFAARITALMICALGTGISGIAQAGPPQDRAVRKSPPNQHTVKAPAVKNRPSRALPAKPPKRPTSSAARVAAATAATAAGTQITDDAKLGSAVAMPTAKAPSAISASTDVAAEVVFRALSLLGVNYRFGGNSPAAGLDCSGLVRLVYSEVTGLNLPRRSDDMSRVGGSVDRSELQPGDLVFFNTLRMPFSHVGIFIGNGQFVHSPSSGSSVRVENMNLSYWQSRFNGARRLVAAQPLATPGSVLTVDTDASGMARPIDLLAPPAAVSPAASPAQRAPDNMSRSILFVN